MAVLVVAGCGGDDDGATTTTSSTAAVASTTTAAGESTTTAPPSGDVTLTLTEVASGLTKPLAFAVRTGTEGFYVAEQVGRVLHLSGPAAEPEVVLDISGEVSGGNEQGLLGLTFSPDGSTMYISYTNADGDSRLESVSPDGSNLQELFATDQPYANHNGGNILFGPDGALWLGLGDGGAGGDPEDRAQDPDTVLGKLLRFDVSSSGGGGRPEPQVWAHGVRNPWRFSFDRETDDLWVGDVGQNQWEEIDRVPAGTAAGSNFGWPQAEGTHGYKDRHPAEGSIIPVYEYSHEEGQSVAGGYVYRGSAIPGLVGTYLFSDTYTGRLWSLVPDASGETFTFRDTGLDVPGALVSSFGEDADGELYVLSLAGGVYRIDAG